MMGVLLLVFAVALAGQAVDPAALSQQAGRAMAAGQFEAAAGLYRQLVGQLPKVGGLRMNLGLALFQAGKHREAAGELAAALRLEPGLAPAAMMLGLCHAKLGEPLAAIPLLERALRAEAGNAVVQLELADAYYAVGRYASAVEGFRRLTALRPADPVAWRGLGLSLTGHSQELFGKLAPTSAEALTLLARARMAADEPKAAYRLLRQALERDPAFGPAHGYMAELTGKASSQAGPGTGAFLAVVAASDEALAAYGRLAALPPSVALYETEAEAAQARGAHVEAVAAWRKALRLAPGKAGLERGLARALFAARNFEEALPVLRKHGLSYELGAALLETGKAAEAVGHLVNLRTPAGQAALGRAYLALDQPTKAIGPLRAALATDTDGSVHFQLARALQRTGAAEQAREMDRVSQQIRQARADEQAALDAVVIGTP